MTSPRPPSGQTAQPAQSAAQAPMLLLGARRLPMDRPLLMGVVNLTDDSFSDGGLLPDTDAAERHARDLVNQGADILDLGAESTRPGAMPVSPAQELARLVPLIERLNDIDVPISVDTRHPETMTEVLAAGVEMINDVNALQSPGALDAIAASQAAVCLMHMQGDPLNMQHAPVYQSVVTQVAEFLEIRCDRVRAAGISGERILIDPGIGFGKTLAHNLALIRAAGEIGRQCGVPVLIGASRKSMLGELTGQPVDQRLAASIGAAIAAVSNGAAIVRVHDVAQTRDALSVWQAIAGQLN